MSSQILKQPTGSAELIRRVFERFSCISVLQYFLSSGLVLAQDDCKIPTSPILAGVCFLLCCPCGECHQLICSVPSEEVFPFFSGHNTERIGEIIIYVDWRHVSLLKHYLTSFDSLIRLREIQVKPKAKLCLITQPSNRKVFILLLSGTSNKIAFGSPNLCLRYHSCGIKIAANLRFSMCNEACFLDKFTVCYVFCVWPS